MASLNSDGSRIIQLNTTYVNIGGAITAASGNLENADVLLVAENSVAFTSGLTGADLTRTQYSVSNLGYFVKTTSASTDATVETNIGFMDRASGNVELTHKYARDFAVKHLGDKVVISSSSGIVIRNEDTSYLP